MVFYYKKRGRPLERGSVNYIEKALDAHVSETHNDNGRRWEYMISTFSDGLTKNDKRVLKDHGLVPLAA